MIAIRLCILVVPGLLCAQSASVLNLSRDLVPKGIAAQNLQPDTPTLDARPLVEAAVLYASRNAIPTVTADSGSYYFLTLHANGANQHVLLSGISSVTIDWQNSDLYFAFSNRSAIDCVNCVDVTMQNFSLDYTQLPFTQVTVTSVNSIDRNIAFQTMAGFQAPSDFNKNRAVDGSDAIYVWAFRNGVPLPIGRLSAARPVTGNIIGIVTNSPWSQPTFIASIQAGDTLVFADRSGPPALNFVNGQSVTVRNVSIYSSGQIGLYFGHTNVTTADRVQVIPRPGTTRLISTNADGIHTSFAVGAQSFTNNIVRRTCDDAFAISSGWIATVAQDPIGASVVVSRVEGSPFSIGGTVSFISTVDATIVGTATIRGETPAFDRQTFTDGEMVTLILDPALPALQPGFGMIDADPRRHGTGSVIRNNLFQEGVFSRGVWLSGVQDVTVRDNFIQRTSNIGVFVQQQTGPLADSGPSSNITIQNNVLDSTLNYGGVSAGPIVAAGAIHIVAEDANNAQVTSMPHSNINILGNLITNSPRSAVRVENVNRGSISGNTVAGHSLAPADFVYNLPPCCETLAQYVADFRQPILVTNSLLVTSSSNNVSAGTASLIANASSASYSPKAAAGSLVISVAPNLITTTPIVLFAPLPFPDTFFGVTVKVTDRAGITRNAPIHAVSPNLVSYLVPVGTAPGVATINIGSFSGALLVDNVAPALYSINASGQGVAAANALLFSAAGALTVEPVFSPTCVAGSCTALPLDLGGPTDSLYVVLYGTGIRNFSSMQNVKATIGGVRAQIAFIGAQETYPGLDQVNLLVPRSLIGAGEVPIVLTVDGQTANVVTISVK